MTAFPQDIIKAEKRVAEHDKLVIVLEMAREFVDLINPESRDRIAELMGFCSALLIDDRAHARADLSNLKSDFRDQERGHPEVEE